MHVADVSLEAGAFVDVCLETQTGADVRGVLGGFADEVALALVALDTAADQDERTERFTRKHVETVHAQRVLLIAFAVFLGAGVGGAHLHIPRLVDSFTELQAGARAALVDAEVVVRLEAVDARLDVPRRVDDRVLGHSGKRRAQGCCGEGDFLSFIQSELPINKGVLRDQQCWWCTAVGPNHRQNVGRGRYATAPMIGPSQICRS